MARAEQLLQIFVEEFQLFTNTPEWIHVNSSERAVWLISPVQDLLRRCHRLSPCRLAPPPGRWKLRECIGTFSEPASCAEARETYERSLLAELGHIIVRKPRELSGSSHILLRESERRVKTTGRPPTARNGCDCTS